MKGIKWFFRDYASRHRNPWNAAFHVVGVPLAPFGCLALLVLGQFAWAAAFFVVGYLCQWIGHTIEGNEVGEWILIKYIARRVTGAGTPAEKRA